MWNVARDVCTFLQTCEVAVLSTKLASFKLVFKLFSYSTVKFIISKQNLSEITQEKKENET